MICRSIYIPVSYTHLDVYKRQAYSRGIISSRKIEAVCRENMLFIAVSGDSQPHFTTLAAFIANAGDLIAKLFAQVLLICDRQGFSGK